MIYSLSARLTSGGKLHRCKYSPLLGFWWPNTLLTDNSSFNSREEDFETLRHYNDYLNEVEDITFNLIHNINVESTRAKLNEYRAANEAHILQNQELDREDLQDQEARRAAEQDQARLKREAARREDEEGRRQLHEAKHDVIAKLASGDGDAVQIAREGHRTMLKQSRKLDLERSQTPDGANGATFTIRGLKKRERVEREKPYDPFGGLSFESEYYKLQDEYDWDELKKAKTDMRYLAGGYDIHEFYARALCDAFSGLGVFVADEMAENKMTAESAFGTAAAVDAATTSLNVEDPFG